MSEPQEKVVMSALKDTFLECPVCVEHFNQTDRRPRLLHSCLHAFCTQCLQQLLTKEGKGQITCPLCRKVHKVPGKADTLPVDAVRAKLVDFVQIRNEGKVPCTDCPEGNTAESRCPECSLYLCKDCTHVHKRHQLTNDHTIISLIDVLQQPLNTFGKRHCCTHHPKHQLEFFCTTDETLCCMACTVMEHKGHEFQKLEEAAKKRQDELETLMQAVHTNAQQLRQRRLSEEGRQNTIVQAQGKAKSDVSIYFKSLTSIINQRKALLDQDIDQRSYAMLSLSKKEVEAIDQTLAVMDSTVTYFTQAREKADVVEMLQVYPAIKRSLETSADGQGQGQPTATEVVTFCPSNGKIVDKLVSEVGCVRESTETKKEKTQLLLCLDEVFDAALKYNSKIELIKHFQEKAYTNERETCAQSPDQKKIKSKKKRYHTDKRGHQHDQSAADQLALHQFKNRSRSTVIQKSTPQANAANSAHVLTLDSSRLAQKVPQDLLSYTFELPSGIKVEVSCGNIVKCKLQGIVSAADGELRNFAGVAGAIEQACGNELRRECESYVRRHGPLQISEVMHTSPGDLIGPRYILHTVGPVYVSGLDDKCAFQLTRTFLRCLQHACNQLYINSIAFPFISTGVFDVPIDICIQSFLDAIVLFSPQHTYSTLKEIHLLDTDVEKVQTAIVMLQQHLEMDVDELQAAATHRLQNKCKPTHWRSWSDTRDGASSNDLLH